MADGSFDLSDLGVDLSRLAEHELDALEEAFAAREAAIAELAERVRRLEGGSRPSDAAGVLSEFGRIADRVEDDLSDAEYRLGDIDVDLKANVVRSDDGVEFKLPGTDEATPSERLSTISFSVGRRAGASGVDHRTVPDLVEMEFDAAKQRLKRAGFAVGTVEYEERGDRGTVIDQFPTPESVARPGATVDLVVSGTGQESGDGSGSSGDSGSGDSGSDDDGPDLASELAAIRSELEELNAEAGAGDEGGDSGDDAAADGSGGGSATDGDGAGGGSDATGGGTAGDSDASSGGRTAGGRSAGQGSEGSSDADDLLADEAEKLFGDGPEGGDATGSTATDESGSERGGGSTDTGGDGSDAGGLSSMLSGLASRLPGLGGGPKEAGDDATDGDDHGDGGDGTDGSAADDGDPGDGTAGGDQGSDPIDDVPTLDALADDDPVVGEALEAADDRRSGDGED